MTAAATYLAKAEAALAGARLLLQSGDADGACSRAYYAMFDAARSALVVVTGADASAPIKTHNGLIAAFGQQVVLTGHVAAEHGQALNRAQKLRLLADYSGDPVPQDAAAAVVSQAEAFVAAIRQKLPG